MYNIDDNTVYYNDNPIFEAPCDIWEWETYKDDLIINYRIPLEEEHKFSDDEIYRNVVCIDQTGTIIWRVQGLRKGTLPFTPSFWGIHFDQNGVLWAYDGGWENLIDPETGKILDREFTK